MPVAPKSRSGVCRDVSWDLDLGPKTWLSSPPRKRLTGGCRDDVQGRTRRPWRSEACVQGPGGRRHGSGDLGGARRQVTKLSGVGLAGRAASAGRGVRAHLRCLRLSLG